VLVANLMRLVRLDMRLAGPEKESKMLVLSRSKDESIMIGEDVKITIIDVRGNQVRLGITAPRSIEIHRREVFDKIAIEKRRESLLSNISASRKVACHCD